MNKEKKRFIKYRIVFPLIVATIAIGVSYLALYYGGKYFANQTAPLEIQVEEDGTLSLTLEGKRDDLYILWETDGGNIKAVNPDEDLAHTQEESNRGYMCYTHCDEKVRWDSADASGEEFETATVRAVLYLTTDGEKKDYVGPECYEGEFTVTIHKDGSKFTKVEDRFFSNPVKKGVSEDWSEIYPVKYDEEAITFRYRTSKEIVVDENNLLILCWENEDGLISQTDLTKGLYPDVSISEDADHVKQIKQSDLITVFKDEVFSKDKNKDVVISAFLVDGDIYTHDSFSGDERQAEATIGFSTIVD